MTLTTGAADDWVEAEAARQGARIEIRNREEGNPSQNGSKSGGQHLSKNEALSGLRRVQQYMGFAMLLSAAAGVFLMVTDHSLWILAISHAIGLVVIVMIDLVLGIMNLYGSRRIYLASLAGAFLGIMLQLGDIVTAPQYNMAIPYFASYLFGLGAFDALLALQTAVLVLGLFGRTYVQSLSARRREGRELSYSRRTFAKTIVGFGALVGLGVILGSIKIPPPTSAVPSSGQNRPLVASSTTAIANTNSMQPGSYVYFEYPQGYPNMLFKRSDGTLAAYSLLCTHVCCECSYDPSSNIFYCPCHGSVFGADGRVLRGPAQSALPTITLNVDNAGNVYPSGTSGYTPC